MPMINQYEVFSNSRNMKTIKELRNAQSWLISKNEEVLSVYYSNFQHISLETKFSMHSPYWNDEIHIISNIP